MSDTKRWIVIKVKKEYSKYGIPEMVGIYYNPYNKPVLHYINTWIVPEFRHQVYGYKIGGF